jgi:hypothetical protein
MIAADCELTSCGIGETMPYFVNTRLERPAQRWTLIARIINWLIWQSQRDANWPIVYAYVFRLLESVPLSTDAYALAGRRLRNAQAYAARSEFGAAAFELRLLHNQLC